MRYKAAKEAGLKEVPIIVVDLTKDKENEFIVKDNISGGEWNWDELANSWDTVKLEEWGLDIPQFVSNNLEAQEDDFEVPEEVKTDIKLGDLFEIGEHRLMCGDSCDSAQLNSLMNGLKADMVFTDPPYGVSIGKKNRMLNSFQKSGRNLTDIVDDEATPDELKIILTKAFTNLRSQLKDCYAVFVTAPQGGGIGMMMMMMMDAGLPIKHVLIWLKNSPTFSMGRLDYDYKHEPILFTWTKTHKRNKAGEFQTSIWEADKPRANKEHPTMKPVALPSNAILNHTDEGDLVVDIYNGSGTTMVAAHQLKRRAYTMEIMPNYCQVTIDRMMKLDPSLSVKKNGKAYKSVIA